MNGPYEVLLLLQGIAEGIAAKFFTFHKIKIKFKKSSRRARFPTQGTSGSAGFDLYSTEKRVVLLCPIVPIQTDIRCKIPRGYLGKIHPRSS